MDLIREHEMRKIVECLSIAEKRKAKNSRPFKEDRIFWAKICLGCFE